MLISHRKRFIFFHLPKAAGSSVEAALRRFSHIPSSRLYNYMIDYLGDQKFLNLYERHMRPRDFKAIKPSLFSNGYLKFAVVRNSWDWHFSQYNFHKNSHWTIFHAEIRELNFSEYVDWATREENMKRANSRQKEYLSDSKGNLLVDRVLRFESLSKDFDILCKELNVSAALPKINRSARSVDYRDAYSATDQNKIQATHSEDIDYFGFEF